MTLTSLEERLTGWLNDPLAAKALLLVLGLVTIQIAAGFLHRFSLRYVAQVAAARRLRALITGLGYLLSLVLIAGVFRDRLGGLTLAFGVAGAGVAFALQEVIASVAGWFAIVFGNIYSAGDRVEMATIRGDIIGIGLFRTTLMEIGQWMSADTYTGRIVRITNGIVLKEPVYNYSSNFPFVWDELKIPIRYGSDAEEARQLLALACDEVVGEYARGASVTWLQMLKAFTLEHTSVEPTVTLALNDNWIELTLRYVVDYRLRVKSKDAIFTRILDGVNATCGRVAFASSTVHLVQAPPLEVVLKTPPVSPEPERARSSGRTRRRSSAFKIS